MATIVHTRIIRLQAINPRSSTVSTGLGVAASWTSVTSKPTNVAALSGSEAIKNDQITVDASGRITGIGTGTLTFVDNAGVSLSSSGQLTYYTPSGPINIGSATLSGLGAGNFAWLNALTSTNIASYVGASAIGSYYINDLAASKLTAGTLAAGVVYAGTINASQINAGTITASLSIYSSGYIYANGVITYSGVTGAVIGSTISAGACGVFGDAYSSGNATGVFGRAYKGFGVRGEVTVSNGGTSIGVYGLSPDYGVYGESTNAGGCGVAAVGYGGGTALSVYGLMTIDNTTTVSNLAAETASKIRNSGHTYTFSDGIVGGTNVATFSGVSPGVVGGNGWLKITIDGSGVYWIPAWPNV